MHDAEKWLALAVLIAKVALAILDMMKARRGNDGPSAESDSQAE